MRLSDVLGAQVRDGNQRVVGVVRDVRATVDQDEDGRWRSVRIDAIVVAPRWRLWPRTDRPRVFAWLDRRFDASARVIPWKNVVSVERGSIGVRSSR